MDGGIVNRAMFESAGRLQEELARLLESLRALGEGRYAALFDPKGLLLESPQDGDQGEWALRSFLQKHAAALFRIPAALHDPSQEMEDAFEDWVDDEFFLAFVNGRVGLLVACPDAKRLEEESPRLLKALVDRLLRLNPTWRLDEKGRGLFAGRPRLDTVAVGRSAR
jgi:hypothetical protein